MAKSSAVLPHVPTVHLVSFAFFSREVRCGDSGLAKKDEVSIGAEYQGGWKNNYPGTVGDTITSPVPVTYHVPLLQHTNYKVVESEYSSTKVQLQNLPPLYILIITCKPYRTLRPLADFLVKPASQRVFSLVVSSRYEDLFVLVSGNFRPFVYEIICVPLQLGGVVFF